MAIIKFASQLFTTGRTCPLEAVVLHQYASGIEMLDAEMRRCIRPRPLVSPGCHTSFHFGIGNCVAHQYVEITDTAWGFYYDPPPTCPVPPCPIEQLCDGIGSDQYNPDFDGNPAISPAAGADNTANCSVIHVAISTGSASVGDGIFCINSPLFDEDAYRCLVRSLCEIFELAGLVPVSGDTLLSHIGELVNLDLDQLAIDILACLEEEPAPLPPCNCAETANTVTDSTSINFAVSGPFGRNITGDVIVSPDLGNRLVSQPNGLFAGDAVYQTCQGDLQETDTIITSEAFLVAPESQDTTLIWAGECPAPLRAISCEGGEVLPPETTIVLGAPDGDLPLWSRVQRQKLNLEVFTEGNAEIDITQANSGDVWLYTGQAPHSVSLVVPTSNCGKNDLWIKNRSNSILTVTSTGLIDGQNSIQLDPISVGNYPFGNDGGEAVHLVSDGTDWYVL